MKLKQLIVPVITILIGLALTIIASLFKILHWAFAAQLLTTGMLLIAFGILLLVFKLILHVKRNN